VHRVERIQALGVFEGCARCAPKSLFQDSNLGKIRKDKAFESTEGQLREVVP
jgi:hypothetical protein